MTPEFLRVPLLCALISAGVATDARTQTQAPASAARPMPVAFSSNGQQLNYMVGRGVALADVNRDGALDAFVVNESGQQRHEGRVYLGDGRGQFTDSGQRLEGATGAGQPVVHDIDGNGCPDVIVGRTVWVNDGRGRFVPDTARFVDADGGWIRQCSLGDLNGDGWPDLIAIVLTARGPAARVYLNDKAGHFRNAGEALRMNVVSTVELGDVNGDGFLDAVVSGWRNANADASPNRILLNDGEGRFTDSGQVLDEAMRHSHGLELGDVDRDGDLDIVLVTQGDPPARLYINDGKGRFTPGRTLGTSSVENVAAADFNGDGSLDIFLACLGPDEVWLNDGSGMFTDSGVRLGADWSWQLAVADINGDRLPDVFVVNLGVDRTAPPERMMQGRVAEVWLNTTRKPR